MIASAGGALHPPLLTVAAPVLCDGDMDITSRSYSYKPGQHGTSHTIRCERQGRAEEVTLRAIGVSTLIYGAGARLRQLKTLRDQGLISAQDYESRKQEILNEL
ncbi:MAG TPA: SHOCT domain-containing protein [Eoetvoesiella sp.]|uniref:SHOCT domain-containing protein n=1 Tax=Eoetvoesiella sp. TaxID=1966355 RepID=UPI002CC35EBB|nr:SHOCT domain-containing protein [Eoetvoesiella sp.]HWK61847.1 SHOCT domain-containing protein [Eoetvoesiella sp.]